MPEVEPSTGVVDADDVGGNPHGVGFTTTSTFEQKVVPL